ncbi:sugar transferase [Roseofilum casamattae]|uniref:Sugar transferase n=1 Tax=Roseofilum casamattae BLCC-M143 TaxID=3022442 RepID=A0ABT7BW54_9CYAN|nr:sugar transferase [Roseofilum casamattae]MDJ1182749.1 sugar transferase [Roseofilum casamattae BLCC-M143]
MSENLPRTQNSDRQRQDISVDLRVPKMMRLRRGMISALLRILAFILLDTMMVSLAWKSAKVVVEGISWLQSVPSFQLLAHTPKQPGFLFPILVVTIGMIATGGLYGDRYHRRQFGHLLRSITMSQGILIIIAFIYQPGLIISRSMFFLSWIFVILYVVTARLVSEATITTLRRHGRVPRRIFLIGNPKDTLIAKIALKLDSNKEFAIVGQLDLSKATHRSQWEHILEHINELGVGEVFFCSWSLVGNAMQIYWSLKNSGIALRILPIGLEIPHHNPQIEMIGGMPSIQFQPPSLLGTDFMLKRGFDLFVAITLLAIGSPLFIAIAIAIKLDSPGPIFFKQTRMGLKGRHFKVWKYRTMVINADRLLKELETKNEMQGGVLFKMKDDPRITKVGKFLRRYSLDELPQIINVLIGEMSLVGPRPLPLRDIEGFAEHHFMRHNVLPGITGLWQVSGRSDIKNFEDAFKLDMSYINNWSLALDFEIILRTVKVVFGRRGAY